VGLTEDQRRECGDVAELKVRRYMDELFERVLPKILKAHDDDVNAHYELFKQHTSKLKLIFVGFCAGGGVLGLQALLKLVGVL
jgi:dienelactone hydrolase